MSRSLYSSILDRLTPSSSRRASEDASRSSTPPAAATAAVTSTTATGGMSGSGSFQTATIEALFAKTDPAVDGEECLHDCASCTTHYPAKFSIDEEEELYGHVKGFETHLIVATGKTDWVRDVEDEVGSVMEAVGKCGVVPSNGVSDGDCAAYQATEASWIEAGCMTFC